MIETEVFEAPVEAPVPLEPTTPMKPSEALRLGCLIAPKQSFGFAFMPDDNAACALGAIYLGRGWSGDEHERWGYAREAYQEFTRTAAPCACLPSTEFIGQEAVWHMNDRHRWTRERIADWLEGLGL